MHARMLSRISSADFIFAYCLNPWPRVLLVQVQLQPHLWKVHYSHHS